ncbi:MAG: serine/threonine-protein kinase, partial [Luteimonas sp.]
MDAERWQRLSPLLDALLELDPGARARSLAALREDDPQLAADLDGLLAMEADGDDFLSEPLIPPLPGPRPGGRVGPYQLERMLGEGGMGQVWLAIRADGLYQRRVALKLLRPGLADPNLRLRFTRERQILARLEHPHIARLLDAGISGDSQPYLALEYVEGEPLTDWCKTHALSVDACLRLFLQVCAAVSHAHANLIVHRDLKPSNILVTALDEVRLLDFGIAKLLDTAEQAPDSTRTGLRAFTLHYAAPEQIRSEPVTTMTDVYSLGVVLYELLSGHTPYRLKRDSDAEWEDAILHDDPLRPSVAALRNADGGNGDLPASKPRARQIAGDLDNIVLKALGKRPEQRYASVEALALDLQRYRDGRPVHARPQSMRYRLRKYVHRHHWALGTALLVTLMFGSTLGIVAWQARQSVREGARTQALQDFVVGLFENAGSAPAGTPLDVRQLLDTGVARGDRELARQPVERAELFGVIARLRVGLGDYDQALRLLLRQRAIVAALGDSAPASLRLESATDLGRTQHMLGRQVDCVATMRPLQTLARREEHQLPAQSAEYYTQLARCQRTLGERSAARLMFERALSLRRDPLRDETGIVDNLAELAGLRADGGDSASAERALRAALAQLRARV